MATDDVWRDRITVAGAIVLTAICATDTLVMDYVGKPTNAFVITIGTVAFTVFAGYGKAGFNAIRGRSRPLDNSAPPERKAEPDSLVKGGKP